MKNHDYHEKVIQAVTAQLREQGIDAYLILTGDDQDPMPTLIPGVDTVGSGAFLFTADGHRKAITSKIDAQDVVESGLFETVDRYEDYDEALLALVTQVRPAVLALDFSENDPFCDGLTLGRYEHFRKLTEGKADFTVVSADQFIPKVRAALGTV